MARYSPTVRREEYSPLAAALDQGLEGGIRGARLREERERSQEGRYDRQRGREWEDEARGRERTIWDREDFRFEDEVRRNPRYSLEPPEAQEPGPHSEMPEAGIQYGQDRSVLPEVLPGDNGGPSGPVPGQYVPGVGFAPPTGGGPQLPVEGVQDFNAAQARAQEPVASVGDQPVYSTGMSEDDIFTRELEREMGAMRGRGEVEADVAGDVEASRRQARAANPTPSEQAAQANTRLREEAAARRRAAEDQAEVEEYADFFMRERGDDIGGQRLSRILQARFPDADPEMVDQVGRDRAAGLGASGEAPEQDTELYDNVTKLVPPATPVQRATARAIASGASTEEQIRAMASEAGLNEDQLQEALDYLKDFNYAR